MKNTEFIKITSVFIPEYFNWPLFITGELVLIVSIMLFWIRDYKIKIELGGQSIKQLKIK